MLVSSDGRFPELSMTHNHICWMTKLVFISFSELKPGNAFSKKSAQSSKAMTAMTRLSIHEFTIFRFKYLQNFKEGHTCLTAFKGNSRVYCHRQIIVDGCTMPDDRNITGRYCVEHCVTFFLATSSYIRPWKRTCFITSGVILLLSSSNFVSCCFNLASS